MSVCLQLKIGFKACVWLSVFDVWLSRKQYGCFVANVYSSGLLVASIRLLAGHRFALCQTMSVGLCARRYMLDSVPADICVVLCKQIAV